MPRASDINPRTFRWNVGLCGEGGCGKSTMASTFPGTKMVFEFDDKPAAYHGTDTIYHTFNPTDDDFRECELLIDGITQEKGMIYLDQDGNLFNEYGYPLTEADASDRVKCDVFILDSVTGMEKMTMAQALVDDQRSKSPANGPAKHHYLYCMQRTGQLLEKFKMLPGSRIVTFHFEIIDVVRNDVVVNTNKWPLMVGKTRFRVRKEMGEWYHFLVEPGEDGARPEHKIMTHAPDEVAAFTTLGYDKKNNIHILDPIEKPDFKYLIEKIEDYWRKNDGS